MNKADLYYKNNLKQILEEGSKDENPRPKYKDGTPAHCFYITQIFEEYNINKGEFPLTTLRNTAIKTGIKEIFAIYQQQVNTREGFARLGVTWWEDWMNSEGNIGRSYSHNLESHRANEMKKLVVKIVPRIVDIKFSKLKNIKKLDIINSVDNIIYESNYRNYGKYIIIDKFAKDRRCYIKCQFLNTGYITTIREDSLKKGQHPKNNLIRTNINIGYLDDFYNSTFSKKDIRNIHKIWTRMFKRCYNKNYDEYYHNKFVHQDWHSFKIFLNDIRFIPQFFLAKEDNFIGWSLDKDYYGSNCYSKDTCVFLTIQENSLYKINQIKPIKIIDGDLEYFELSYTALGKTLNISKGYTRTLVKRGYFKKLKLSHITDTNYLYRYELSKNQLNSLLYNLEKNPFSRRHIISFWNWSNIEKKELVECAYETLWSVRKIGEELVLDLTLIQRSNDYIMAGYINKIQYVALQLMICSHLGYKPGKFCHLVQNLHVYDRHIDAANEIIQRESLNIQPYIKLKYNKNFYDFNIDDFEIGNIDGIIKIKSSIEIAI